MEKREELKEELEDMYKDNYGLVKWFISRNGIKSYQGGLDTNEWEWLISQSLIKAICSYDEEKGKLSTLFSKIAERDVISRLRKPDIHTFSIDYLMEEGLDNGLGTYDDYFSFEIMDILGGPDSELWSIINLQMMGYSIRDIAELKNKTFYEVLKNKDIAYDKIRKAYLEEM